MVGSSNVHFEFSVGFQAGSAVRTQNRANQDVTVFDYKKTIAAWNVSYIVVTDPALFLRCANHQTFDLVFKNPEIEIYKIKS
jgi:hypothetical protein